jgi:AraC-like DNA-binding protein
MLRVSILVEVPHLLRQLGQDPDLVLDEVGLDPALLHDPDNTLAFRAAGALLEHCVMRTGCRHFGLLLGQRGSPATIGMVGQLIRHSTNVDAALRNLIKYMHHHDRGAVPTFSVSRGFAALGYAILEHDIPASDQIFAASLAVAYQIMRELCGADWRPSEVLFPFRSPHDTGPFERFFQAPVRFAGEQAALMFPADWLGCALSGTDPGVHQEIKTALQDVDRPDLADHVRRVVRGMLVNGGASEEGVAHTFAMSRRTLIRRLQAEGLSFHTILRNVRLEVAAQLLRDTDNSIADIATAVGYAGASPFTRAFKRWTGMPPASWRKRTITGPASR